MKVFFRESPGGLRERCPLHSRRRRRADGGAAAVEFAIVSGVLVLLLLGLTQFGVIFYQWLELEHAAREGARSAALWTTDDVVRKTVQDAAPGITIGAGAITIARPAGAVTGHPVTVTVRHNAPILAPLMGELFGGGGTVRLVASATQRIE